MDLGFFFWEKVSLERLLLGGRDTGAFTAFEFTASKYCAIKNSLHWPIQGIKLCQF